MGHDLELLRTGAVYLLWAGAAVGTAAHVWFRLQSLGAGGMEGDTYKKVGPFSGRFGRKAQLAWILAVLCADGAVRPGLSGAAVSPLAHGRW